MEKIIIYATRYGTAKKYANYLAERLNLPLFSIEEITEAQLKGHTVIFISAVYAGSLMHLKDLLKVSDPQQEVQILTVGLTDPENQEKIQEIFNLAQQNANGKRLVFLGHLPGALTYDQLSFLHKTFIKGIHATSKNKSEVSDEVKLLRDVYKSSLDFVDFSRLDQLT
ncbi:MULTISPECIES: flavodoxin domain-containing protein [Enterococcus]|uniref:Flavodoxin domain-containing protein n=1 Tax=Enterococcus alishanensis TaxID=1303817 RepID=A0ABS6TD64_9ENTE|nr:flavodoxin domain-containing protein [Enterococcus alishanensis]MBV7390838.1 flavodoxin domain-containing protein [Enterococcus alishanensis]